MSTYVTFELLLNYILNNFWMFTLVSGIKNFKKKCVKIHEAVGLGEIIRPKIIQKVI